VLGRGFHRHVSAGFAGTREDPGGGGSVNRGLILSLKVGAEAATVF